MSTDRIVRFAASLFVLKSLAFGITACPAFLHANWLGFAVFVGANLFQSSFTGFCPLERILGRTRLFGCTPRGART